MSKGKKEKALIIRTCNVDMTSHGGFLWPKEGPIAAPDWSPEPVCGKGLHGLIDGIGDYSLLSREADAIWQIAEVDRSACIELDGKVKFQTCNVVYSGSMAVALSMISNEWIKIAIASGKESATTGQSAHAATTGEYAHAATTGWSAHAATTGRSAHAATTGEYAHAATTGWSAHAATTGWSAHAATTGDSARAATTGRSAHAATTGEYAHAATEGSKSIACCLGQGGQAMAGEDGAIILVYWDEKKSRPRVVVGYVGEKGIKAGVQYRLNDQHKFKEVK